MTCGFDRKHFCAQYSTVAVLQGLSYLALENLYVHIYKITLFLNLYLPKGRVLTQSTNKILCFAEPPAGLLFVYIGFEESILEFRSHGAFWNILNVLISKA